MKRAQFCDVWRDDTLFCIAIVRCTYVSPVRWLLIAASAHTVGPLSLFGAQSPMTRYSFHIIYSVVFMNHVLQSRMQCPSEPNTHSTQHTVLAHATISTMNIESACCEARLLLLFHYTICVIVCSLRKFETTHIRRMRAQCSFVYYIWMDLNKERNKLKQQQKITNVWNNSGASALEWVRHAFNRRL